MAHVHGFLSGELGLFEDLESRGGKKRFYYNHLCHLVWLHKCICVKERSLLNCTGK